jgi:hypothetical protein
MTYSVANVAVTNTFDYWRGQTNYLAYAMSTYAVTTNGGTTPVGNAAITGSFGYGANSQIWSANVRTTGTSTQIIDSFPLATYRTAEYIISVKDNNANSYYSSKILVTHDGGTSYTTEYSILQSNSAATIGPFTSTIASGNVNISFTPVSTNTNVQFHRILVSV